MIIEVRNGIRFNENDIVELDNWIPAGEFNPYNVRPWLFHDHGCTLAVVFASCLQYAFDIAADNDTLDRYLIDEKELKDYPDEEGISYLGNACEPFDIESVEYIELDNPRRSFTAQFHASQVKDTTNV